MVAVTETNQILSNTKKKKKGVEVGRKLLTVEEFWIFIVVMILAEIHGKNKIEDNWKTNEFLVTPIFSKLMAVNRWKEIASALHFCNNNTEENKQDKFLEN
jgi:hypothetical protein